MPRQGLLPTSLWRGAIAAHFLPHGTTVLDPSAFHGEESVFFGVTAAAVLRFLEQYGKVSSFSFALRIYFPVLHFPLFCVLFIFFSFSFFEVLLCGLGENLRRGGEIVKSGGTNTLL